MRTMKLSRIALACTAFLLLAGLAVPTVSAQSQNPATLEITQVGVPSAPIKPEIETPSFTVNIVYRLPQPVLSAAGIANQQVPISIRHVCESDVSITGPSTRLVSVEPGPTSSEFPVDAQFRVTIPRTAPGLTSIGCVVYAKAAALQGQTVAASEEVEFPYTVTADYYALSQVKVAQKLKNVGPQKTVPFELEVTNFGNARTQYTFALTGEPGSGRWEEVLPENLLLDSPNSGQGTNVNTAVFQVSTTYKNGWNNQMGSYQLTINQVAASDVEKQGLPMTANILLRVRGVYVPTLEPLIMVGAVLGMAFVGRLRQD